MSTIDRPAPPAARSRKAGTVALASYIGTTIEWYSGASISYVIGSVIGGGIAPLLATALFVEFGTSAAVSTLMAVLCLVSLLAILPASRRVLQPGEGTGPRQA
jgi:hypothetical protein